MFIAAALAGTLVLAAGCERSGAPVASNVSGPISSIDHEKGIVEIAADPATLRLSFAPETTRNLSEGEVVTARLVLAQASEPAMRAYDAPDPDQPADVGKPQPPRREGDRPKLESGGHSITGKVTQIDHTTGVFDVRSGDQILTFYFPPNTVSKVKDGDEITVRMELTSAS
jgi:hypothetical protein